MPKTKKIDKIKLAVWNLSMTYDETAKKLTEELKTLEPGSPEHGAKQKDIWLFKAYARGASNAYLAVCAACKNK